MSEGDEETKWAQVLAQVGQLRSLVAGHLDEEQTREQGLAIGRAILSARAAGQRQSGILAAVEPTLPALVDESGALLDALVASTAESAGNLVVAATTAQELAEISASIEIGKMSEAQARLDVVREGGALLAETLGLVARAMIGNREIGTRLGVRVEELRGAARRTSEQGKLSTIAEAALADTLEQVVGEAASTDVVSESGQAGLAAIAEKLAELEQLVQRSVG